MENLHSLHDRSKSGDTINGLTDVLESFVDCPSKPQSRHVIEQFLYNCNLFSDGRPTFTGFWGEVKDLLDQDCDDWANRLRDRFGLGHLDPLGGENIPVLLLRYRVSDVLAAYPDERRIAAVPTVLDGDLSPFFFPTPSSTEWEAGQTLDLSPGAEETYTFTCELLHRFFPYQASFVYRVGSITQSPGKTCEEARSIHLAYLEDDLKHAAMLS